MLRSLFAVIAFSALFLAACGGGSDSGSTTKGGGTTGGPRAMAASIEADLTNLKDCYQGEKDGKGPCGTPLLTTAVTTLCSDVRTGKANAFGVTDFKPFEPLCASWASFLSAPPLDRTEPISGMIAAAQAIK